MVLSIHDTQYYRILLKTISLSIRNMIYSSWHVSRKSEMIALIESFEADLRSVFDMLICSSSVLLTSWLQTCDQYLVPLLCSVSFFLSNASKIRILYEVVN